MSSWTASISASASSPVRPGRGRTRRDDEFGRAGLGRQQTWLVLGGGGLFAVFPLAYALSAGALHAADRDAARPDIPRRRLRVRSRAGAAQFLWDWAFARRIDGRRVLPGDRARRARPRIAVANRGYAGGWSDWLTPFGVAHGRRARRGYALLGATWLIRKTEGVLQARAYRFAWFDGGRRLSRLIGAVSLWTPFLKVLVHGAMAGRGRIWLYTAPVLMLVAGSALSSLFAGLKARRPRCPVPRRALPSSS